MVRLSLYEQQTRNVPVANRPIPSGVRRETGLAYEVLLRAVASFGGGPNVNSRSVVTKGGFDL